MGCLKLCEGWVFLRGGEKHLLFPRKPREKNRSRSAPAEMDGGWNLYAMVGNDPVGRIEFRGMISYAISVTFKRVHLSNAWGRTIPEAHLHCKCSRKCELSCNINANFDVLVRTDKDIDIWNKFYYEQNRRDRMRTYDEILDHELGHLLVFISGIYSFGEQVVAYEKGYPTLLDCEKLASHFERMFDKEFQALINSEVHD
jgi:predicted SprT family Zn-dependent metalloprotease